MDLAHAPLSTLLAARTALLKVKDTRDGASLQVPVTVAQG